MFRSIRPCSLLWRSLQHGGLEHLTLRPQDGGLTVESVVIGESGGNPFGVRYRIEIDAGWYVRRFDVATTDGRGLALRSDGPGHWQELDGSPRPDLDGCIDIDLAGSPFTNTLPIRRLEPAPEHGGVELTMLYVPFDDFAACRDGQVYTCLEPGRRYHYEAADGSFEAELAVDEDGLVLDYPTLFERSGRIEI